MRLMARPYRNLTTVRARQGPPLELFKQYAYCSRNRWLRFLRTKNMHCSCEDRRHPSLIGGRDLSRSRKLAEQLGLKTSQGVEIDVRAPDLASRLLDLDVATVIQTAGPFQGQNYMVAQSAIAAGANYIDLADGRDFVVGIEQLNTLARERGVFVTSGASSLPALSSAVVDRYVSRFSSLHSIRHGIGSGARSPGLATMKGIFGYCGKPFRRVIDGQWQIAHGWLDMQRYAFCRPVGRRFLGSCDVPDWCCFFEDTLACAR